MADEPHYPTDASSSESLAASVPPSSSGAFITNSRNFTIAGGHFTNVIHCAPTIPSDFRTIPLGDLDLRKEIRLGGSGVVSRQHGVVAARRMYTARIEGKPSDMTVAIYEGEHLEETWRRELGKYSGFRHPNFVQLYGMVNSGGLYAMIFHDDLVPLRQFLKEHQKSVISTVYLHHYFSTEFSVAEEYFQVLRRYRYRSRRTPRMWQMCISWIRRSTGQLSVEIAPGHKDASYLKSVPPNHLIPLPSLGPDPETSIISRLTLDQFHNNCVFYLGTRNIFRLRDKFQLSAVVSLGGKSIQEIARIPNLTMEDSGWVQDYSGRKNVTVMENGWSRLHSSCTYGSMTLRVIYRNADSLSGYWLSQANHVFSQSAILPEHEDYVLVYDIKYRLRFSGLGFSRPSENVPEGYLFLCPLEDFQSNDGTYLATPELPAYWSLNPTGGSRLRPEDASRLGFQSFTLKLEAHGKSWPENVYAALGRFHAGKGFDPNSQDVAQHLGHPIFELTCSPNVQSAHIEEVSSNSLEDQPDPVLASRDAWHTQRFRLTIGGLLGLIMALVVTWSYCK